MPVHKKTVYICSPLRTPIGSFGGSLAGIAATDLGAHIVQAVIKNAGVAADAISEVIMGCVLTAGLGQAPARQVLIKAGLPNTVQAMTINKVCSSGLAAVQLAARNIELGISESAIAGGMESMSQAPYLMPSLRAGARLGHVAAVDSIIHDGLWDPYQNFHMGNAAELCAKECKISREDQDAFALESYRRANEAIEKGFFKSEIAPLSLKAGKTEQLIAVDEEPGKVKPDKVKDLEPVFQKDGTVTAANASSINDGASAMLLASEAFVMRGGAKPVARIVAQNWNAQAPEWFTTAPIGAIERVLADAGSKVADIDLFEINEAFSCVAIACCSKLQIPAEKLNIAGGAVALGHPIGASGARILTTLIHNLKRTGGKRGVAAICNGGGEATALMVEMV